MKNREFKIEDSEKIREFLSKVFLLNNKSQHSWLPMRWDDYICRLADLCESKGNKSIMETTHIWLNENDEIVGVVNSEDPLQAHLQIHPDYRSLEEEMIKWAENHIADKNENGELMLIMWSLDSDKERHKILEELGYIKQEGWYEYQNINNLEDNHDDAELPDGFKYLSMKDGVSWRDKCNVQSLAFHGNISSDAKEPDLNKSRYYNEELDLFTYNGKVLTSFCTVWIDEENKMAKFEPVGTHPEFRRMSLGRCVIEEGLRRARKLGVTIAYVDAGGENREAFYKSAGFKPQNINRPWFKYIKQSEK